MAKDTTVLGKAFEYACLLAIYNALKDIAEEKGW